MDVFEGFVASEFEDNDTGYNMAHIIWLIICRAHNMAHIVYGIQNVYQQFVTIFSLESII